MSAQSFERAMHHEATKRLSLTTGASAREFKGSSAPGEKPVDRFSDRGSIPLASTRVKMSGYSRSFLFCLKALGLKGFEEMRTAEEKGGMCMIIQRKREKNGL